MPIKNHNEFPIAIHNSAPRFIAFPNLFDSMGEPGLAKDLIEYLESCPEEQKSNVNVTYDTLTEVSLNYSLMRNQGKGQFDSWFSKGNLMAKRLHECILPLIQVMNEILPYNGPIDFIDSWDTFWIRKYTPRDYDANPVDPNKKEAPMIHVDFSASPNIPGEPNYSTPDMASLSIALNDGDEYEGGEVLVSSGFRMRTPEDEKHFGKDGRKLIHEYEVLIPKPSAGDGVVWDGWTYHGINPVTKGARYVLIVHFQGLLKD